jgi:hypothetical protein
LRAPPGAARLVVIIEGLVVSGTLHAAAHDYYPFGASRSAVWQEQLFPGNQNNDGMRFAGHWRDYLGYVDAESPDYLDYMPGTTTRNWGAFYRWIVKKVQPARRRLETATPTPSITRWRS